MLQLQTKVTDGFEHELKGKCIEKVYVLNETKPESSEDVGFSLQVFETIDGTFFFIPPSETTAEVYVKDTLSEVYETIEEFKKQDLIAKHDG